VSRGENKSVIANVPAVTSKALKALNYTSGAQLII